MWEFPFLLKIEKDLFNNNLFEELERLKPSYFNETNPVNKQKYKKQIDELISEITHGHSEFDFEVYFSEVFHKNSGFDVVIGNPPYIKLQKDYDGKQKYADLYKNEGFKVFDRMGDIYCLFYEKGMQILKEGGILGYITSNKWMRAGYGEKLREFFTNYNPLQLIDLGPGVFESATVDTNILIIQKSQSPSSIPAGNNPQSTSSISSGNPQGTSSISAGVVISRSKDASGTMEMERFKLKAVTLKEEDNSDIAKALNERGVILTKLTKDAWFIGGDAELRLKEKIERIGKPLKEWDVEIYRGILTGLNEAFIITTEKRNEILANCRDEEKRKRTEAIIKPILRGRDIKRYHYEWAGLWVIVIPAGWTNKVHPSSLMDNKKAEKFINQQLPALMQYLKPFEEKAKKRDDQGDYWWELRACAYYPEFEKEKVVWQEMSQDPSFAFDQKFMYCNDTGRILTGSFLKFFLGIFNSKFFKFSFSKWYAGGGLGDKGIRFKSEFMKEYPLPSITPENEPIVKQIESLVDQMLEAQKGLPNAKTESDKKLYQQRIDVIEHQIDELVYQLYGLTEEEKKIVEGKNDE